MFKRESVPMILVLILLVCEAQGAVIDSSWIGPEWGSWGEAGNWSPVIVPDNDVVNTFAVTIDSSPVAPNRLHVALHQDRTIDRLDCYGDIHLEVKSLDWIKLYLQDSNGLANHGKLEIWGNRHNIQIYGNITNVSGGVLELGRLWIYSGDLVNASGARLHLADTYLMDANLSNEAGASISVKGEVGITGFDNDGIISIVPSCLFSVEQTVQNNGRVTIYGGSCSFDAGLHNSNDAIISGSGMIFSGDVFNNEGEISSTEGSLTLLVFQNYLVTSGILRNSPSASLHIRHMESGKDVNNLGTIEVNTGGVTFDCNLVNEPNGVIKLLGGTLAATTITQSADANFAGFGGIAGDVVIEPNGIIQFTGPTNVVGDVEISSDATLEISDGTTLVTGQTTCNGTIHMKGGRIIPQGGFSGECNIIWEPGLYNNIADFNLDGQVDLKDFADFGSTWLWQAQL